MKLTVKARLHQKVGVTGNPQLLMFSPDYSATGDNKGWTHDVTPHLDFRVTVNAELAKDFPLGDGYTLTIARDRAASTDNA